jgi:peptidyl-tRNA hydrolase, PTH1 family
MDSLESKDSRAYNHPVMKPELIVIGLGNVGKAYEDTRHNVGFQAVEIMAEALGGSWADKQKFQAFVAEAQFEGRPVLFAKPTTYMNLSGQAIKKMVDFYKLDPASQILVVCDDIDLPLGTHRFRMNGGPGTHNGLKSVIESFGEAFPRLRIGLGRQPEGADLAGWVLSRLPAEDRKQMWPAFESLPECMRTVLASKPA